MNFRLDKSSPDPMDSRTLDRLVDGSLSEAERHALLRQFDSEAGGWRRCALAFLEAQTWREALAPLATAAASVPAQADPPGATSRSRWLRSAVLWPVLAASLLMAFLLGRTLGRDQPQVAPLAQVREAVAVAPNQTRPAPPETVAVAEEKQTESESMESNLQLEVVVKSLLQQGYAAEYQNTNVTMTLPDGSEQKIPAQEIRLRYIGNRTY